MNQTELKIRVTFMCAALLALTALVVNLGVWPSQASVRWPALGALAAVLVASVSEAAGIRKIAKRDHWRLAASVLFGVAVLLSLEP